MSIIDDLYSAVAHAVVGIHAGLRPVFGPTNGYGWALSIVLLTMAVRLLLFPLFVKQIKSQRTLQMIQPLMKEIREKHKNDKQKMNEELMKLQKEHGNPLLGCLPIFAQIPLFIALFRVLNGFKPREIAPGVYQFVANHGLSAAQAQQIGNAKIFGVPLSVAFNSPSQLLKSFIPAVSDAPVRVVTLILVVIMCTTTFLTQKQIMGRNGPVDPSQRTQQRVFLYLAPLSLGVSGIFFGFPVGVLLYWMTTNLWSMGQQFFVLRRMPPVVPAATTGRQRAASLEAPPDPKGAKGAKGGRGGKAAGTSGAPGRAPAKGPQPAGRPSNGAQGATPPRVRLTKRGATDPEPEPATPVRLRQARREALRGQAPASLGVSPPAEASAGASPVSDAAEVAGGTGATGGTGGDTHAAARVPRQTRPPQRQKGKSRAKSRRGGRR